jgi:AbrB family looped-hinge helix DNA binding protein
MVFMNGISLEPKIEKHVSLDKAGRIVVPKPIREALQLRVGEPLKIEQRDDEIVLRRPQFEEAAGRGLLEENGLLVYDSGVPIGDSDIVQWIHDDRERRSKYVAGIVDEP